MQWDRCTGALTKKIETEKKESENNRELIYEGLIQSIHSRKQTKHNKNTAVREGKK